MEGIRYLHCSLVFHFVFGNECVVQIGGRVFRGLSVQVSGFYSWDDSLCVRVGIVVLI